MIGMAIRLRGWSGWVHGVQRIGLVLVSLALVGIMACDDLVNTPTPQVVPLEPPGPSEPSPQVTLRVLIDPPDSGSVDVQRYGLITTEKLLPFDLGEPIILIARPNRSWLFQTWNGAINGEKAEQSLNMDVSKQVRAVFIQRTADPTTGQTQSTIAGTVKRVDQHNTIELEGNHLEKYESGENMPGLYLSMDLGRLGDFLELYSDDTFYLEEYSVGYRGHWELKGSEIVLTLTDGIP